MAKLFSLAIVLILCVHLGVSSAKDALQDDNCTLIDYKASCTLDVMDEHVEASVVVNHCHIPIDITFRVVYRYGNDSEQRWKYTFVTSNQNERVLIPGLVLPPAPNALVYLFVRIPEAYFDPMNPNVTAIQASFIAIVSASEWEEVEFINDLLLIQPQDDCYVLQDGQDSFLWIVVGSFVGFLVILFAAAGLLWLYKKRKRTLENLALVSSLETGLPGAQPYQIMGPAEEAKRAKSKPNPKKENNNNAAAPHNANPESNLNSISTYLKSGFTFGRLKEEEANEIKTQSVYMNDRSMIIGNPVLVSKSAVVPHQTDLQQSNIIENKCAQSSPTDRKTTNQSKPDEVDAPATESSEVGRE